MSDNLTMSDEAKSLGIKWKSLGIKWIEALESGKYEQAQNRLCRVEDDKASYCCLGVLCDLTNPNGWRSLPGAKYFISGAEEVSFYLPNAVFKRIGLSSDQIKELAAMNDRGESFKAIATKLREFYSVPQG